MENNLPEWLQEKMNELGWSNKVLADEAGLSEQAISNYLNVVMRRTPKNKALISLARALKESPTTLYEIAGLTQPADVDLADLEDFREILKHLDAQEREELKRIGWLKIDMKKTPIQKGIDQTKK